MGAVSLLALGAMFVLAGRPAILSRLEHVLAGRLPPRLAQKTMHLVHAHSLRRIPHSLRA